MTRLVQVAVLVAVVAGVLAMETALSWAGRGGGGGRISVAFVRQGGQSGVATMRPDGSALRVLVKNPSRAVSFRSGISPDGRWVVFDRFVTTGAVWRVRVDGSHLERVVGGGSTQTSFDPAWSPDGRWIVYAHGGDNAAHLGVWVVHPDGSAAHQLVATNFDARFPVFSPDGRWIAFTELLSKGGARVAIARADGSHVRRLRATGRLAGFTGDWSPNGRWIAFGSHETKGLSSIYVIHPDGSGLRRVTRPGRKHYNDVGPTWNPQSSELAFDRSPCPTASQGFCPFTGIAIWEIGADGSHPHAVTHATKTNFLFPDWSPSGR
jgi:Tol biopolymer transport system component